MPRSAAWYPRLLSLHAMRGLSKVGFLHTNTAAAAQKPFQGSRCGGPSIGLQVSVTVQIIRRHSSPVTLGKTRTRPALELTVSVIVAIIHPSTSLTES